MSRANELADALTEQAADHKEVAHSFDMRPEDSANWRHHLTNLEAATELRRLDRVNAELHKQLYAVNEALWKACADDKETVYSYIESQDGDPKSVDALTSSGDHL